MFLFGYYLLDHQALSGKVKRSKSERLNLIYIKAAGNAGNIKEKQIKSTLDKVMGFSTSSNLITQTIYSFRKVLSLYPSTVSISRIVILLTLFLLFITNLSSQLCVSYINLVTFPLFFSLIVLICACKALRSSVSVTI